MLRETRNNEEDFLLSLKCNQENKMKINFKDSGGRVLLHLDIIGKEDSEDWLQAMVYFEQDGFRVDFKMSLMLNDLYAFIDQLGFLQKNLKGEAVFDNIEGNINLKLSTDRLGHIVIDGSLWHPNNMDLKTSFKIDSDQTFLPNLITECKEIIRHYKLV